MNTEQKNFSGNANLAYVFFLCFFLNHHENDNSEINQKEDDLEKTHQQIFGDEK